MYHYLALLSREIAVGPGEAAAGGSSNRFRIF